MVSPLASTANSEKGSSQAPLSGLRVVDLSTWIAGAYCTKLLADGGAEVIKVEPPEGDPLRRWSASGAIIEAGNDAALFNYLHASKESVVVDANDDVQLASLQELLASADAVVWSRGSSVAEHRALVPQQIRNDHPNLTVTTITPFGLEGAWSDRPATEFTLQAWSGGIVGLARGRPDREPVYVGGQIGEWLAGLFAAIGTLAAGWRGDPGGDLVDVSMLEALASCLTYYPVTFNDQMGRPMRKKRFVPTPGVGAASDGLVGLGVGTGQQWLDFCAMVEHPEWTEDPKLFLDRTALASTIDEWIGRHTVDEVLELTSAFRIPNAPVVNGENATTFEHFRSRGTFAPNPKDSAANPRPPYRLGAGRLRPAEPAPRLGEHSIEAALQRRKDRSPSPRPQRSGALPFEGLRVLDMTAFWAGPLAGHLLALLGAEVIHLESANRPDGVRLVGGVPQSEERYWERGPIFAALNTNKKSLTLDLRNPRGNEVLREFVKTCDVVIENYTPRVLDQLGVDYETLRSERPDLVMVRMPGFGLDGPWRDQAAFAFVIEDASGLTWLTGHPDLLPFEPYTVGDPNAGLHALFGLLLALQHRRRTGEGGLVEASMVDAALNVAAEQVVEHSAYGALLERQGNRGPTAAPQNLYRVAKPDESARDDTWVAIAVANDEQWRLLRVALGEPAWADDAELEATPGRLRAQDEIDVRLGEWCRGKQADDVVRRLSDAGVPVATVTQPHHQPDLPPFQDRRFFEEVKHPVIGNSRYSTLPIRFERGPERWHTRHAPLLGEHNRELLGQLGLTSDDLDALEAEGVIGESLVPGT
ncbi:MAG TPA: CoA transferase [Acidimicrobiales bacterium]|nr:CoA transferase [Acidimicrobiales bacterium]